MRVLIVAATEFEVGDLISESGFSVQDMDSPAILRQLTTHHSLLTAHHPPLTILITGVGMVATAFALGKHLAVEQYDLAINLGIAGSFDRSIALGEVVEITEDTLSELGAEDDEDFLSIETLGFGEGWFSASAALDNLSNSSDLKKGSAITVNTVHGNDGSIKKLITRIQPQLESMEGAAFFYACKQAGVPCMQIRTVSNYVEKRNRDNWQIGLAIKNLNTFAGEFLKEVVR